MTEPTTERVGERSAGRDEAGLTAGLRPGGLGGGPPRRCRGRGTRSGLSLDAVAGDRETGRPLNGVEPVDASVRTAISAAVLAHMRIALQPEHLDRE
jgi:hypothetical protein